MLTFRDFVVLGLIGALLLWLFARQRKACSCKSTERVIERQAPAPAPAAPPRPRTVTVRHESCGVLCSRGGH